MKKFLIGLLTGLFLVTTSLAIAAPQSIRLIINGNLIKTVIPPQIIKGQIMVSPQSLAGALGATVAWNSKQKTLVVNSLKPSTNSSQANNLPATKKYSPGESMDLATLQAVVDGVEYASTVDSFTAKDGEIFAVITISVQGFNLPSDRYGISPLSLFSNLQTTKGKVVTERIFLGEFHGVNLKENQWVRSKVVVPIPAGEKLKSFELNNLGDKKSFSKVSVIMP